MKSRHVKQTTWLRLEALYTVLVLLLLLDAFSVLWFTTPNIRNLEEGDPLIRTLLLLTYLCSLPFLVTIRKAFIQSITQNKLLMLLLGICVVSILWSDTPDLTFRKSLGVVGASLFGLYFGLRYLLKQQLQLLMVALTIAMIASIAFVLFLPEYGVMNGEHNGRWRGIFTHKNILGRVAALYLILSMFLYSITKTHRWSLGLSIFLAIAVLWFAESSTAMAASLVVVGTYLLYKFAPKQDIRLAISTYIFSAAFLVIIIWLTSNHLSVFTGFLGRDVTLTGRTIMWQEIMQAILERPWFGYGYKSFWATLETLSPQLASFLFWTRHSHNGFLDLLLDLGFIGLLIYLLNFCSITISAIRSSHLAQSDEQIWPSLYLTFVLVNNFSEGMILIPNSLYWMLYVAVCVQVTKTNYRQSVIQNDHNKSWVYSAQRRNDQLHPSLSIEV